MPHQAPQDCQNMQDIRREIDEIDRQIIALFGERYRYVQAAARYKTSEQAVRAPERLRSMLAERRAWAVEENLDPDAIERLYRDLIEHFIQREMTHWQNSHNT